MERKLSPFDLSHLRAAQTRATARFASGGRRKDAKTAPKPVTLKRISILEDPDEGAGEPRSGNNRPGESNAGATH